MKVGLQEVIPEERVFYESGQANCDNKNPTALKIKIYSSLSTCQYFWSGDSSEWFSLKW